MEFEPITGLNHDQQKILKQIIIVADGIHNEIVLGNIFYKRQPEPSYNLIKQAQVDAAEPDPFAIYFREHPQQENYPVDEIDSMILAAVRTLYPKSIVRNDLILFNVDLEKLAILKNKQVVPSKMYFSPEFSSMYDLSKYVNKNFPAPVINFNIYTDQSISRVQGINFFGHYPVDNQTLMDKLSIVQFE